MAESQKLVLTMDLTPNFMSSFALRKVAKSIWPGVRKSLLRESGQVCEICGFAAEEPRYIDAHEVFEYPEDGTVRLVRIQLLCKRCHDCKHFDHLLRMEGTGIREQGRSETIIEHFCRVNDCPRERFDKHLESSERRRREIETKYGCNIPEDRLHYGPYHERVVQSRLKREQRRIQREEDIAEERDAQFWEPLPDHELIYTPEGELYGHRWPKE